MQPLEIIEHFLGPIKSGNYSHIQSVPPWGEEQSSFESLRIHAGFSKVGEREIAQAIDPSLTESTAKIN